MHNQNNKAQNEADARKKIQMISNRLDSGDDFATLAMNYSEDPETSGNGGDLGTIPESSLRNTDPGTRDAVIKLKPGQYSPVITLSQSREQAGDGIPHREAGGKRACRPARFIRSARAASHPLSVHERREQLLKAAYYEVLRDSAKVENYYAKQVLDSNGLAK